MQGESQAATTADFSEVFERDSHDRGAEPVAPDTGQPRDDQGRFAPKQPEATPPEPPVSALVDVPEPASQPRAQQEVDPPRVPVTELQKERNKRQEAERRALEIEAQNRAYADMLQRLQQQQPAPQQQQVQSPPIDPYTDPEGYGRQILQQAEIRRRHDIANFSESVARRTFGPEIVDKAQKWAIETGVAQNFFMSADPYGDLIDAYKRVQAMQEIGPDPSAYKKKIREEVLAELKAGGTQQPAPKFPGSLAGATAAGTQGAHLNPEAAFDAIFDTNRNRRQW